ncbi:MAG: HAD-IC family P-type ATPase [bacterium]|nr:HAD-IC family P-type ATPase [bacterium]
MIKQSKEHNAIKRLLTAPDNGLTSAQAEERILNGAANVVSDNNSETIGDIICSNVFTYFNFIFAVLAALLIMVGAYRGLTFLPVILANTLIGIVQQIRSKRNLDKLNMMSAPEAHVIRDGKPLTIPAEETVLDDIALFSSGNQIYADAIILDGNVRVNEALLTGEADEITRSAGDILMSGSFIVSGECRARLERVGNDSYIARLSAQAKKKDKHERSKMMRALNTIIKFVGIAIIPIGIIMFIQQYFFNHSNAYDAVSSMVAALLGMIPEGLYLLASAALALSVIRLSSKKVNVHDMSCVETLARVNVLCVDKTGTITENTMKVKKTISLNNTDICRLNELIGNFSASMKNDNMTMQAVKEHFEHFASEKADRIIPFSSKNKYSAASFGARSYVIGAPEFVLRDKYKNYKNIITKYTAKGFRVLVFAKYYGSNFDGPLTCKTKALGLILLGNPVRPEAIKTFGYFREQGVEIKVISGDNPLTASEAAIEAGIYGAKKYIDASTLKTDAEIADAVKNYTVFGRVTPEMKRSMIHALQKQGNTVAMTGDGVNDVLALKDADCSVAMGSGSEAASRVAQIVLMESDFSRMPDVLLEGRRVVNNIERSAGLFLIKNIFSFLLALSSMLASFEYPLHPSQVTLINMFTIGTPGFLLALENNKNLIKGSFIKNVLRKSLPAALTNFIAVCALIFYGNKNGLDSDTISTITVLLVASIGFFVLAGITRPYNRFRIFVLMLMIAGFVLSVIFLRWVFMLTAISSGMLAVYTFFAVGSAAMLMIITRLFDFFEEKI